MNNIFFSKNDSFEKITDRSFVQMMNNSATLEKIMEEPPIGPISDQEYERMLQKKRKTDGEQTAKSIFQQALRGQWYEEEQVDQAALGCQAFLRNETPPHFQFERPLNSGLMKKHKKNTAKVGLVSSQVLNGGFKTVRPVSVLKLFLDSSGNISRGQHENETLALLECTGKKKEYLEDFRQEIDLQKKLAADLPPDLAGQIVGKETCFLGEKKEEAFQATQPWYPCDLRAAINSKSIPLDIDENEQQALSLNNLLAVLKNVSQVVRHLHVNNIIHRDIYPKNILINQELKGCLTDFGLSTALKGDDIDFGHRDHWDIFTSEGVTTPFVDYYGLAMVLAEVLFEKEYREGLESKEKLYIRAAKNTVFDFIPDKQQRTTLLSQLDLKNSTCEFVEKTLQEKLSDKAFARFRFYTKCADLIWTIDEPCDKLLKLLIDNNVSAYDDLMAEKDPFKRVDILKKSHQISLPTVGEFCTLLDDALCDLQSSQLNETG